MGLFFEGTSDKDALSYQAGDTVRFSYRLTDGEKAVPCHQFVWTVDTEDGISRRGIADGKTGQGEIITSLSRAGFIHITVKAFGEDGKPLADAAPFEGGVGADVDTLLPALPDPADFDDYWKRTVALLDDIPPRVLKYEPLNDDHPTCDRYNVQVYAGEPEPFGGNDHNRFGAPVSAYVSIPKDVKDGKTYPLLLTFSAYSFSGAELVSRDKYIVCAANPHGLPNGLTAEEYGELQKPVGWFGFYDEDNQHPDTVYFKGTLLRNIQALRYAKTLPGWDGKTIEVEGGSMGAFQSTALTALCPEVTRLKLHIPWLCDLGGILDGRLRGWRPNIQTKEGLCEGIRYYDTANFGRRVTCPVWLEAGLGDYICPPSGVMAFYNAISSTHKELHFEQNRTHAYCPPASALWSHRQNY